MSPIRTCQFANHWKIALQVIRGTVRSGDATAHASHRRCLRRGCPEQFSFRAPSSRATLRPAREGDGAGSGTCTAITSACRRHRPVHCRCGHGSCCCLCGCTCCVVIACPACSIAHSHSRVAHSNVGCTAFAITVRSPELAAVKLGRPPSTLMLPLTTYTYTHTPVSIPTPVAAASPRTSLNAHLKDCHAPREALRLGRKACSCAHPETKAVGDLISHLPSTQQAALPATMQHCMIEPLRVGGLGSGIATD